MTGAFGLFGAAKAVASHRTPKMPPFCPVVRPEDTKLLLDAPV
jgi:hypothetical protein